MENVEIIQLEKMVQGFNATRMAQGLAVVLVNIEEGVLQNIVVILFRCASISRISYDHHSLTPSVTHSLTPSHFSPNSANLT